MKRERITRMNSSSLRWKRGNADVSDETQRTSYKEYLPFWRALLRWPLLVVVSSSLYLSSMYLDAAETERLVG